uniref:NADH dehydrogenase subunit 6 n=1 Tax=Acropyga acutiventris TaxID=354291 RepID=A0A6G5NI75_9HYME|nr:NADH dehydrogenase subunit 6 [Acropyga acutiventris]
MINTPLIMDTLIFIIMFTLLFMMITNIMNFSPIMILINLLIYSMMICIKISMWKPNFMYSIILFLIMISGLLIMFMYFSSLISNEQNNFILNKLLFVNLTLNFLMFMSLNYNLNLMFNNMKKFYFTEINTMMEINEMNFQNILNLYTPPFNNLTIIAMFYLLISLFSIIKICSTKSSTLRKIKMSQNKS